MFVSIDYANKLISRLQHRQDELIMQERSCSRYSYYSGETPIVPDYNFQAMRLRINDISQFIIRIKHDIREVNMKGTLKNLPEYTIDEAILKLSFLNKEKTRLGELSAILPERSIVCGGAQGSEIHKANFDIAEAKKAYNAVCNEIIHIQDELNTFNVLTQIKIDDEVESVFED